MILHDFVYSWDGKTHSDEKPITWWPGSYRVRIVKLDSGSGQVTFIRPLAVIVKNQGTGTSLKNYIQNFAQKISAEYGFDLEKALWIEMDDKIRVAQIGEKRHLQTGPLYLATWREIRPNEREMLMPYFFDVE